MSYADFLARKRADRWEHGVAIDPDDIHPMLHGFQRDTVTWAARTGRSAVFLDCGMGKTFVQLEWARLMPGRTLIVAPLSVARQTVREAAKIGADVAYRRDGGGAIVEPSDVERLRLGGGQHGWSWPPGPDVLLVADDDGDLPRFVAAVRVQAGGFHVAVGVWAGHAPSSSSSDGVSRMLWASRRLSRAVRQ